MTNILHLILKEILFRKFNFLLSCLAIITAVTLFVSFFTTAEASKRETTRLMRNIGFNLRILPKETDMDKFWATGVSKQTMPEEYVYRFAEKKGLSYAHLTATLQKRDQWRGQEIILTGISPEVSPPDKKHSPMIFTIQPGTLYIGYEIAKALDIKKGDTVDLLGKEFTVARCLAESGTSDDIRVYGHLPEIQELLGMEGQINEIMALECLCRDPNVDTLVELRRQLSDILPEAKVIQMRDKAKAREQQRIMVEEYLALILPFVVIVCAIWIGALAMLNTRERQTEIGVLRALGYTSGKIAGLFLGRAVVIGVIGAVIGFAVGTAIALVYGPKIFKVMAHTIEPIYILLLWSIIVAPAFAAISSFIPAMIAVTQDPAVTLREE